MSQGEEKLKEIAELIASGRTPDPVTVRTFLSWFGAQRRGFYIVRDIRSELKKVGLKTAPDFEYEYIDGYVRSLPVETKPNIVSVVGAGGAACGGTAAVTSAPALSIGLGTVSAQTPAGLPIETVSETQSAVPAIPADPTYRVGKLAAANRVPTSVKPDSTIAEATTLMLINNFSQLPVMQTEMTVKGVVSWSSIGKRLALGLPAKKVSDCMDRAVEKSSEDSLFAIIADIVQYQYVLIRGNDNRIKLITAEREGRVALPNASLFLTRVARPSSAWAEVFTGR